MNTTELDILTQIFVPISISLGGGNFFFKIEVSQMHQPFLNSQTLVLPRPRPPRSLTGLCTPLVIYVVPANPPPLSAFYQHCYCFLVYLEEFFLYEGTKSFNVTNASQFVVDFGTVPIFSVTQHPC